MPLWHCVRENFSELLKIRSFSVKNCTNDQEKQEQTRSNSHLPVGNVSNQYKGNTEKKKNLQTAWMEVLDLYPHGEKNHSPQPLAKKQQTLFKKVGSVRATNNHNSLMAGCLFNEHFLHEWQLMSNRQILH